jgi:hypothetical protein
LRKLRIEGLGDDLAREIRRDAEFNRLEAGSTPDIAVAEAVRL